jgi:hypothetical protein
MKDSLPSDASLQDGKAGAMGKGKTKAKSLSLKFKV